MRKYIFIFLNNFEDYICVWIVVIILFRLTRKKNIIWKCVYGCFLFIIPDWLDVFEEGSRFKLEASSHSKFGMRIIQFKPWRHVDFRNSHYLNTFSLNNPDYFRTSTVNFFRQFFFSCENEFWQQQLQTVFEMTNKWEKKV